MKSLAAAILAGGMGTRFQPVRKDIPKILAPVAGRPFITYQLDQLADAGLKEVILLTGHLAGEVRRELGEVYRGMRLIHCEEKSPLGTGGAIRSAKSWVGSRPFLVMNGDSYVEFNTDEIVRFHSNRRIAISLVLANVSDTSRFGQVTLDHDGKVTKFQEKVMNSGLGPINAGVYIIQPFVLEKIPEGKVVSLEREILPEYVQRGEVYGLPVPGRFIDIGTPESYAEAPAFFLDAEMNQIAGIS